MTFLCTPSKVPFFPQFRCTAQRCNPQSPQLTMASGQIPRPDRWLQQHSLPPPDLRSKHAGVPFLRPAFNPQRCFWVEATKHRFHQLILFGEGQPSNGTVRRAEPSNGETHFNVAYGDSPDRALQALLVCY